MHDALENASENALGCCNIASYIISDPYRGIIPLDLGDLRTGPNLTSNYFEGLSYF